MATSASIKPKADVQAGETLSWHPPRPRRFLGLDPEKQHQNSAEGENHQTTPATKLHGIIFDVDGTLCLPQNYMFREMRAALEIDKSVDILDHIRSLSTTRDNSTDDAEASSPQSRAQEAIRTIERNAMSSQRPQPGLVELMKYLERRSVPKALCTRNFPAPVQHLIDQFLGDLERGFDAIITRETVGIAPKPSPEGLWWIAKHWGLDRSDNKGEVQAVTAEHTVGGQETDVLERARKILGSRLIMVGDSIDDMAAGYRAGAATVLLVNEENEWLAQHDFVDLSIHRLDYLIEILETGFEGRII